MTEAILKQIADNDWNDNDKKRYSDKKTRECDNVMDTINNYLTSFDARVFIPNNKDTYQTEIDAMIEEAGIPLHYLSLITAISLGFQAILSYANNHEPLFILTFGNEPAKMIRGTVPTKSSNVRVIDCGCVTHPENMVNRSRLVNPINYPPQLCQRYDSNICMQLNSIPAIKSITLSEEGSMLQRWGDKVGVSFC